MKKKSYEQEKYYFLLLIVLLILSVYAFNLAPMFGILLIISGIFIYRSDKNVRTRTLGKIFIVFGSVILVTSLILLSLTMAV